MWRLAAAASVSVATVVAGTDSGPEPADGVLLMIDPSSVETVDGASFHLNQAKKHPGNPVLLPGTPDQWDSLQVCWPATVLYSPAEARFRCWYAGLDALQAPGRFWQTGYAESTDGVTWTKPDLGQAAYRDQPTNRVVIPGAPGALLRLVFENPDLSDPRKRFGGLFLESAQRMASGQPASYYRAGLAWSADGRTWTRGGVAYEAPGNDRPSYQDICEVLFDPADPEPAFRVKGYSQILRDRGYDGRANVRNIGLAHGPTVDRLADAADPVLLAPEKGIDEELHGCSVKRVGGTYLMLYESDTFSTRPLHGDLKLAVSADGRSFRRMHTGAPLVAAGPRGTWDENLLIATASALQDVGDEVYIYYIGCPNVFTAWPSEYAASPDRRGALLYPTYLGLATLPRDRFAYAQGRGTVTTRPLGIGPDGLWLNAAGGEVGVAALDASGAVLARGHLGRRRHGGVYRNVVWTGDAPRDAARLRIWLGEGSRLYSIRSGRR